MAQVNGALGEIERCLRHKTIPKATYAGVTLKNVIAIGGQPRVACRSADGVLAVCC